MQIPRPTTYLLNQHPWGWAWIVEDLLYSPAPQGIPKHYQNFMLSLLFLKFFILQQILTIFIFLSPRAFKTAIHGR